MRRVSQGVGVTPKAVESRSVICARIHCQSSESKSILSMSVIREEVQRALEKVERQPGWAWLTHFSSLPEHHLQQFAQQHSDFLYFSQFYVTEAPLSRSISIQKADIFSIQNNLLLPSKGGDKCAAVVLLWTVLWWHLADICWHSPTVSHDMIAAMMFFSIPLQFLIIAWKHFEDKDMLEKCCAFSALLNGTCLRTSVLGYPVR